MPLQNSKSIGLVALESPSTVPILIILGLSPAYPVGPWCRIMPLTEVRHARLDGVIEKIRSNDVRVRQRLEPLAELKSRVETRRCGIGNNYEIRAKISITTFLDRHAIQIEIQIEKLEWDHWMRDVVFPYVAWEGEVLDGIKPIWEVDHQQKQLKFAIRMSDPKRKLYEY